MKRLISTSCIGVLALLGASAGFAATVNVVPSVADPLPGSSFFVTISGTGFPNTSAADLTLTFNEAVLSIPTPVLTAGIVLAPGSPFTNGVIADDPFPSGSANGIQVLAGFTITPSGSFDAIRINFNVSPSATPGALANIVVGEIGREGWINADTFERIPVTYNQASVTVGGASGPDIVVTDSVAPTADLQIPFGDVTVSTVATQTVTVTNDGGADLILGTLAQGDALAAPFSLANDTCSGNTVTPASSCTVDVRYSPVATGTLSDSFDIPSNDPDTATVTVDVSGTGNASAVPDITVSDSVSPTDDLIVGFGDVNVSATADQTITVTNDGVGDLVISAVGVLAAPFSIVTDGCTGTLVPAASCNVSVRFAPGAAQVYADSLDIASNDPDEPAVTVNVAGTGTAIPVPNVVVTDSVAPPTDLDVPFGSITQGGLSTQTVTVTNDGVTNLVLGQVASANALAPPFSVASDNCSSQTVAPTASCTFQVQFQPIAAGPFNDSLDIPSNDPDTATVTLSMSGTGVAVTVPDIAVTESVSPIDDLQAGFGNVFLAAAAEQTVTVTNDGAGDLVIGTVGAANPLVAPFSIPVAANGCSGRTLAPAASCTILLVFAPDETGVHNDSFDIPSNDPDEPTVTVAVSGTGRPIPSTGSSALDLWSLALLASLPLIRRRRQ